MTNNFFKKSPMHAKAFFGDKKIAFGSGGWWWAQ